MCVCVCITIINSFFGMCEYYQLMHYRLSIIGLDSKSTGYLSSSNWIESFALVKYGLLTL